MSETKQTEETHLRSRREPLDPSLYDLTPEALQFFKSETDITDDEELKKHILAVQERAYKVDQLYYSVRRF
jgi:hypothetical protein